MKIAAYISGHGFGHLAQTAPVLNRIGEIVPGCKFFLRTTLPVSELNARLAVDYELEQSPVDYGVVQKSAIEEEWDASIALMRSWTDEFQSHIDREGELLSSFAPSFILSNISPLAFPVARWLDVPGVALATLDWHTIYSHKLAPDDSILRTLAAAYGQCDLLLSPPMAMPQPVLPEPLAIPLIAPHPNDIAFDIKSRAEKVALVLFGGAASPLFDLHAIREMTDWHFLMAAGSRVEVENIQQVDFTTGLRPVDLMPMVDVVVCKPGYGVLAECWRTGKPIAWVERPGFPEFPMLEGWLDERFPASGMSVDDFTCGRWLSAMESALASGRPFPDTGCDGEIVAADLIVALLTGEKSVQQVRCDLRTG